MKRFLCAVITAAMVMSLVVLPMEANALTYSDDAFFGYFDYESYSALSGVKTSADGGDYTAAKAALWDYFKAKKAAGTLHGFEITQEDENFGMASLALNNIITGPYEFDVAIGSFGVSGAGAANAAYSVADITAKVSEEIPNGNISVMLLEKQKQAYAVNVYSSESAYAPKLIVTTTDGSYEIAADKDTYINSGEAAANYADAQILPINEQSNSTSDAFSTQTRRAYINFPLTALAGKTVTSASLRTYAYLDDGCSEAKDVCVLFCGDSTWSESSLTWGGINGSVYSWQSASVPSWTKPSGSDGEYLNVVCRFWYARAMVWEYKKFLANPLYAEGEAYGAKLLELMNSFASSMSAGYNRTLETGERLNRWVDVMYEMVDTPAMNADIFCNLLNYMWGDCNYINSLSITNGSVWWSNWRVVANAGFFKAAEFIPEFSQYSTWRAKAQSNLEWTFDNLYNADYSFTEAGPAYAIWCTELYSDAAIMADLNGNGVGEEFLTKLKYTARYAMETMYPNGFDTNVGDSNYRNRMRVFTRLINHFDNDEHMKAYTSGGTSGTYEYLSKYYTNANSAFLRNSYNPAEAVYLSFMNPTATGHAHPDANAVLMYAYGKPLLVDSGRYGYSGSSVYSLLRVANAHNTVEVSGTALSAHDVSGAPLDYTVSNNIFDYTSSTQNGYSSVGVAHNRSVLFLREGFAIVSDTLSGASSEKTYKQNWHFLPSSNASANTDANTVSTAFASEANITIASTAAPSISDGYHSADYGLAAAAKYASFTTSGTDAKIDSVLYPTRANESAQVTAQELAAGDNSKSAVKIMIDDTESYYYSKHTSASNGTFGSFSFDGQSAYVSPSCIVAVGGSSLTNNGTTLIENSSALPSIAVEYTLDTLSIAGEGLEPSTAASAVKIYAPNAASVTLNGEAVPFRRSGNYIYAAAATCVSVHFVDESGTQIADTITQSAAVGEEYSYTPSEYLNVNGTLYFYKPLLSNESTTVKTGANTLTLTYSAGDENVAVSEDMSVRLDNATSDSTGRILVVGTNSVTRRNGFLKFDISALDTQSGIDSAYVVLKTAATANGATTVKVYSTSSDWSEAAVPAWTSMPAAQTLLSTYTQPLDSVGSYRVIDVTQYYDLLLGSADELSLQLLCDAGSGSNNILQYYSKDATDADAFAPALIINYNGASRAQSVTAQSSIKATRGASIKASTGADEGSGYENRLMTDTRWNTRFALCGFDVSYGGKTPTSGTVTLYTGADDNVTSALSFSLYPYDALGYDWSRTTVSGVTALPSGVSAIATATVPSTLAAGVRQAITFDITDYLLANPTKESFNFIVGVNTSSAYVVFYSETTDYAPEIAITTQTLSPYISVNESGSIFRYDDANGIYIFAKLVASGDFGVQDAGFEIWQATDSTRTKKYEKVSGIVPNSVGTFGVNLPAIRERRAILPYAIYSDTLGNLVTIYGALVYIEP